MRKRIAVYSLGALCLLFSSCAQEFNQVYKSQDYNYKYEYAKECFARGKYSRATTLLQDLIIQMKGHKAEQESLYMLAMSEYCDMDYTTASEAFKKYVKSYPRGTYAEQATYYIGQSLYMSRMSAMASSTSIPTPRTGRQLKNISRSARRHWGTISRINRKSKPAS